MTFTSTSMTWWRPPSADCPESPVADISPVTRPVVTCESVTDFSVLPAGATCRRSDASSFIPFSHHQTFRFFYRGVRGTMSMMCWLRFVHNTLKKNKKTAPPSRLGGDGACQRAEQTHSCRAFVRRVFASLFFSAASATSRSFLWVAFLQSVIWSLCSCRGRCPERSQT